ncbi:MULTISPECIES: amino acid adenylation domain-containing protein [unclassified Streptomyces]|uniref:amino acid adenylation domain-containing protein n=1 Tax=unclassified Streptomyces TaxID=2593676 RepID=UPI0029B7516D|nr:amino acid adenylation domain-containing protein [Streptomyces sp. ME18-1-4]MDX3240503.1 amino acid adenylation domain-containing protein [Streptomyces sp. ME18-1-4]
MTLHQLVIEAAARRPDAPAVSGPSGALTYGELDAAADAIAARLARQGVRRGDRVVLWAGKSPATVAATQAVLRLGAAYVPVDGSSPVARVAAIARDCAARVVLTNGARIPRISAELGPDVRYEELDGPYEPAPAVDTATGPDELAYILYTSGSTGAPKGVCLTHANARAFVDWAYDLLAPGEDDRFANHAPFAFDLSVFDLYVAFRAGASVHLVPPELSFAPMQLVEFLHRERIGVWYSVPSALAVMMRHGGLLDRPAPETLHTVLFAGEPFPIAQLRDLAGWTGARMMNLYGPTETNVCTYHEVTKADLDRDRPVPIGIAASGDRVWALRDDGGVATAGEEGELVVDGPTVMSGYWGRPPHSGPYRTGDLVRVLPEGAFDYVGRRDQMVKIRGHRVELGEVESVLENHADVAEAAAVAVGEGVDARLVAFAAPRSGCDLGVLALRQYLSQRLPRYMVADEVRILSPLPRNGNGKIDRLVLQARAGGSGTGSS